MSPSVSTQDLAVHLTALPDREVAALLVARPDLAAPPSSSFLALATRAGAPGSIEHALAGPGAPTVAATQVYELTVDRNFRRSGHASRLLSAVADLTGGQLRVWVGVDDEERQRFYTSAGFAPSGAVRVMGDGLTQHMWWAQRD